MGLAEFLTVLTTIIYNYIIAAWHLIVPPARKSVAGEIVLITGAGHGIGREFALEMSKLGATCVLWDVNKENNEKTAKDINASGGKAYAYVCDVRSYEDVSQKAGEIRKDVGDVSILINNAGILNGGWLMDLKEADIRRTFEVNTLAHFWTVKEFLPGMIKKQKGHILNVVSMAGFSGNALLTDYSASKWAAQGFSESLREELTVGGYEGINVTTLNPMFVTTGLIKRFEDDTGTARDANYTAMTGIDGMLRNEQVVFSPPKMWLSGKIGQLFPRKTVQWLKLRAGVGVFEQYSKRQ